MAESDKPYDELVDFLNHFHFIYPNLNDTFHYACADSERIALDGEGEPDAEDPMDRFTDQDMLVKMWRAYGFHGIVAYCTRVRGELPSVTQVTSHPKYQAAIDALGEWRYIGD
jgi:hypothetical protein